MRVIVCGGRDYTDKSAVYRHLDQALAKHPDLVVIHGAARGADTLAGQWAEERGVPVEAFPASWGLHGKAAGHLRNQQMLDAGAQATIAFPGGAGTRDMVNRSLNRGIKVWDLRSIPFTPAPVKKTNREGL